MLALRPSPRTTRWLLRVVVVAALALVFVSYLSPHLMVDLANRVWACF